MNKIAYEMIKRHEGVRNKPYKDTVGKLTIGVGRNLDDKGLSDDEVEYLFRNDLREVERIASNICPSFYRLSEGRQAALMDMAMMGETRLRGFKKMFNAIARNDWTAARLECLDSKWRLDVGDKRANDVADLLLKG
jgi:lysozyme